VTRSPFFLRRSGMNHPRLTRHRSRHTLLGGLKNHKQTNKENIIIEIDNRFLFKIIFLCGVILSIACHYLFGRNNEVRVMK
jgi:hypothetical protein